MTDAAMMEASRKPLVIAIDGPVLGFVNDTLIESLPPSINNSLCSNPSSLKNGFPSASGLSFHHALISA